MDEIIAKLRAGEPLAAGEVAALYDIYDLYDTDIIEVYDHGDVAYMGIVCIEDNEFYQISFTGNPARGYECDAGICPRVALKQITRYEWMPIEED